MVKIAAKQFGFKEAARNFQKMGEDAVNELEYTLNEIVDDITEIEETVFNSQGRRGGGMWKYPTLQWQRRKLRADPPGDPRVGHFRRKLRRSVTYRGDPNMFLKIDARRGTIQFGSKLPYARTQQQHRPYLKFLPSDVKRFSRKVNKTLKREWKSRARRRNP